ncbi:MAG: hemerythrin family protein [Spirochaetales bacterium]|nr:hemerythrin family protein [Spirochaetales bacterium]
MKSKDTEILDIAYRINIDEIDEQHSRWLEIYQESLSLASGHDHDDETQEKMKILVAKMYEYARAHLKFEEKFMESIGYPVLVEHKLQHLELDKSISDLFVKLFNGDPIDKEKLISQIKVWLYQHILDHDKKIADYVSEKGIDVSEITGF